MPMHPSCMTLPLHICRLIVTTADIQLSRLHHVLPMQVTAVRTGLVATAVTVPATLNPAMFGAAAVAIQVARVQATATRTIALYRADLVTGCAFCPIVTAP